MFILHPSRYLLTIQTPQWVLGNGLSSAFDASPSVCFRTSIRLSPPGLSLMPPFLNVHAYQNTPIFSHSFLSPSFYHLSLRFWAKLLKNYHDTNLPSFRTLTPNPWGVAPLPTPHQPRGTALTEVSLLHTWVHTTLVYQSHWAAFFFIPFSLLSFLPYFPCFVLLTEKMKVNKKQNNKTKSQPLVSWAYLYSSGKDWT